jgi:hypothetical protein
VPVLIEVPALRPARPRPGHSRRRPPSGPGRRRLRREIRVAGYALLSVLPLALASASLLGGRQAAVFGAVRAAARGGSVGSDLARALAPPAISITIEPAGLSAPAEPEPPVVFPGYLLPDDGPEESAHAGS